MRSIRPSSRADALAKLDGRTREARLLKVVTRDLIKHVGGAPSATQRALIDQLAMLRLHIATMDAKFATTDMTEHDSRVYLAWCNSYNRALRLLGLKAAAPERARSLSDYLAAGRPGDHSDTEADLTMRP